MLEEFRSSSVSPTGESPRRRSCITCPTIPACCKPSSGASRPRPGISRTHPLPGLLPARSKGRCIDSSGRLRPIRPAELRYANGQSSCIRQHRDVGLRRGPAIRAPGLPEGAFGTSHEGAHRRKVLPAAAVLHAGVHVHARRAHLRDSRRDILRPEPSGEVNGLAGSEATICRLIDQSWVRPVPPRKRSVPSGYFLRTRASTTSAKSWAIAKEHLPLATRTAFRPRARRQRRSSRRRSGTAMSPWTWISWSRPTPPDRRQPWGRADG